MCLNNHDMYCIKIYSNLESVKNAFKKQTFKLDKWYYILQIYMLDKNNECDKYSIKSKSDLKNYAVICDINNEKRELVAYSDGKVTGTISGIFTTKELLKKLNYTELFHLNIDIYEYIDGKNIIIELLDLKDNGLYIRIKGQKHLSKKANIEQIKDLLNDLNIKYNDSNFSVDILEQVITSQK